MILVVCYLGVVVAANLLVTVFGPSGSVWVALLFIGPDLSIRDALHERWQGRRLWPRMLALIAAGGLLSWIVNRDAGIIAIASTVAFLAAGLADALVFAALGGRSRRLRVNASNLVSAAVDSLVFPSIAFGAFLPVIVLGQWLAKVVGGAAWYELWRRLRPEPRRTFHEAVMALGPTAYWRLDGTDMGNIRFEGNVIPDPPPSTLRWGEGSVTEATAEWMDLPPGDYTIGPDR